MGVRRGAGGTGPGGPKKTGTRRKTVKKTEKIRRGRKAPPLSLRTAKVLDAFLRALEEATGTQVELSLNDQQVLQRIRERLTGAVLRPLSQADITNAKRIAKRAGIPLEL